MAEERWAFAARREDEIAGHDVKGGAMVESAELDHEIQSRSE